MTYDGSVMFVACDADTSTPREWVRRLSGSTSWVLKATGLADHDTALSKPNILPLRRVEDTLPISEESGSDTTDEEMRAVAEEESIPVLESSASKDAVDEKKTLEEAVTTLETAAEEVSIQEQNSSSKNASFHEKSHKEVVIQTEKAEQLLIPVHQQNASKSNIDEEKTREDQQSEASVQGQRKQKKQKKSRRALYKQKNKEEGQESVISEEPQNLEANIEAKNIVETHATPEQEVVAIVEAEKEQVEPETPIINQQAKASIPNEPEDQVSQTAEKVMDVLESYFWKPEDESGEGRAYWPGRTKFKEHAMYWIGLNEPIRMCLPAFPFKSSNPDKVTGTLPDFAEYLALCRLNQLCIDVRRVYPRGGEVTIATDGVAFCDLFFIKPKDCWEYGQTICQMARENFFDNNIKVRHSMEILGFVKPDEITEENFYRTIDDCQQLIKDQFCQPEEAIRKLVEEDPDTCMTYTGFKTFCKVDLNNSELRKSMHSRKAYLRECARMATRMMARSEGFGYLIRDMMPKHIRLSMHPSSGLAKLSICMVPQRPGSTSRAPWMSCIAVSEKGEYQTAHSVDVRDTHDLIYMNGRPWLYRERIELYKLRELDSDKESWAIEHLYPAGLRVWPTSIEGKMSAMGSQMTIRGKLQELAAWQPVEVVQFPAYR